MNLFSSIQLTPGVYTDFSNFPNALFTLIQCATGQNWSFYMFEYAISKKNCNSNQSFEDISLYGVKGCGTYWSYPYFINLFMAIVIEGYLISENEHESIINQKHIEELLLKWSEYDPNGTGFINYENMAFLLHDLYPPIGLKDRNLNYDLDLVLCNIRKN